MKKSILIIALALISVASIAQKKDTLAKKPVIAKDTVRKPEFKPDYTSPRSIVLNVSEASYLIMTPEQWQQLEWSDRYSGQQIQQMKTAAAVARQKLSGQIDGLIRADQDKFKADTAAKSKAVGRSKR